MRPETEATLRRGPRARPGNALLEFVLTLPIIIFIAGLVMYMSFAMLSRQRALVDARRALWQSAGHGHWTHMKLEGFEPQPGHVEDDDTHRPRGAGEELERLRQNVEPNTIARTTNGMAREYWYRLWENLPGRHKAEASRSFETSGQLWDFIKRDAHAEHSRDSSPWHFYHLDAWRVARSGPLEAIFEAFRDNLDSEVAPHFEPTRKDLLTRWWHGDDIYLDPDDPANY